MYDYSARWFSGGKGLDEFRAEMLNDRHLLRIVDFENSQEVFPGVDVAGGICFFLWDKNNEGDCTFTNHYDGNPVNTVRKLNEFPILIRHSKAIPIIRKIIQKEKRNNNGKFNTLSDSVSSRKPFGLPTNYSPKNEGIPCWFIQRIGLGYAKKEDMHDDNNYLNKWKLLIPPAPIAGQTDFSKPVGFYYDGNVRIAKPGEICTESYIIAGVFNTEEETLNFKSYLFSKIVRFLLLQTVVSQHVTKEKFLFVPDLLKYDCKYNDEMLSEMWNINQDEWIFIDSKIKDSDQNE